MIVVMLILLKKGRKNDFTKRGKGSPNGFLSKAYLGLSKNIITRRYVNEIRKRYEIVAAYSESFLRVQVARTFITISVIAIVSIILFGIMTRSILHIMFFSIAAYFLVDSFIDFFVVKLKNRILLQQIDFNNSVRHKYYETNLIDDAIYWASEEITEKANEMSIQGMKIYDALSAATSDNQEAIIEFQETSPNQYLSIFLGLAYMTKEYGDVKAPDGGSVFIKNLGYQTNEIRMEVLKRDTLNNKLRSLNILTLIPLLLISPVKSWAANNFLPLMKFFESSAGTVIEIIMYIVIFASYFIVRKLQETENVSLKKTKNREKEIIVKVEKWLKFILPPKVTTKRQKKEDLIKSSGLRLSIEQLYLRKALICIAVFISTLGLIIFLHASQVNVVLYEPVVEEGFLGGKLSSAELAKANELSKQDREIINIVGKHATKKEVEMYLKSNEKYSPESMGQTVKRIEEKLKNINSQFLKWYELLLTILLGFLGYCVPDIYLMFQKNVRTIEMENEVGRFQSIILMLMHNERINVQDIMEWMEQYAIIFKQPLERCLSEYDSGIFESLERLKDSVTYKPFIDLISNIQLAAESLSIKEAFDELESEKNYFFEARKEANNRLIEKKSAIGNIVGFLPIYAIIALYLLIPMLYVSIKEMGSFYSNIK